MSFSLTSTAIDVTPDGLLEARCVRRNGAKQKSHINLNEYIGNDEGKFDVGGRNFRHSASSVRLESSNILCADLRSSDGLWHRDSLNLDAFIGNDDGRLVFSATYDSSLLRPPVLMRQRIATTAHPTDNEPSSVPTPIQCNLCDDWPRPQQNRISRVAQLTMEKLKLSNRKRNCPTCILAERIIEEFVPNLAQPAKVARDSIVIGFHAEYARSPGLPAFNVKFTTNLGNKVERSCVMYSRTGIGIGYPIAQLSLINYIGDQNLSELYCNVATARPLIGGSTSRNSISLAKRWLGKCILQHDKCQDTRRRLLPARILDVGTNFTDGVKLKVATTDEHDTYACFSHCWGQTQTLTLTQDNYTDLQKDIPWDCLQKSYTEVITLCRLLEIRYIWIDSLCIMQDCADDWKRESAKMNVYYGGCLVCLAATSAADHDGGCSVRNLTMKHHGVDGEGKPYCVYIRPEVPHILDGVYPHDRFFPLLTRAWVYQERRLSPRVLHVTDMELFFECNSGSECECGGSLNLSVLQASTWTKGREAYFANHNDVSEAEEGVFRVEHEWRSFVRAYSRLNLTKQTDRLPALSGLAQMSRSRKEEHGVITGRYLAGCWEGSLINDIAWAIGPELRRFIRHGSSFQFPSMPLIPGSHRGPKWCKPADYIAPSWSWASVMDGVEYAPFGYSEHLCQIHGADIELEDGDPYGQLRSGFLLIRAQVSETRWKWQKSWRGRYAWLSDIPTRQLWGLKKGKGLMWWRDWKDGVDHKLEESQVLSLMPLATRAVLGKTEDAEFSFKLNPGLTITETAYLVLREVDGNAEPRVYERVGWASHSGMSGEPDMKQTKHTLLKLI